MSGTRIDVQIDEDVLKELVYQYLQGRIPNLKQADIMIEVKSKQNYKSEWEEANFRARASIIENARRPSFNI